MKNELKKLFGYSEFRPNQQEIIENILKKRDVFVVMPTGGGKSLCYQLPARLMEGTVVVVSPLISLMKDQVDGALENNFTAACLNSAQSAEESREVYRRFFRGELELLYVSPERMAMEGFITNVLKQGKIALFAFDEAHCISEWGHDFRPDYLHLARVKAEFPGVPVAAFTATATLKVQEDIITRVGLKDPFKVRASFNRPNLFYRVRQKENLKEQVLAYTRKKGNQPGIIYRTTRKSVEQLTLWLQSKGIKALAYHGGMSNADREANQEAFNKDEAQVIVATVAFGMGIDKSNIRYVIHGDMPKNLENYYQETGRAGRDGEKADCLFFFNKQDIPKIRFFIDQIQDEKEQKIARQKMEGVLRFVTHKSCRRRGLLEYFGEKWEKENCAGCDICTGEHQEVDITIDSQKILSAIIRTGERFGVNHIVDLVRGADTSRIRHYAHQEIKTYGVGKDQSKEYWNFIIDELIFQKMLVQEGDRYPVLKISPTGRDLLFGRCRITALKEIVHREKMISVAEVQGTYKAASRSAGEIIGDPVLFEKLKLLRRNIARVRKVPPYVIFSDKTLKEMTHFLPEDSEQLRLINGVGEHKLQLYGPQFLDTIQKHTKRPVLPGRSM